MKWPFVSRARFEDRERQVAELKQELADVKLAHARVVDQINFRSTGFHLDERFAAKADETATAAPVQSAEQPQDLSEMAQAINKVGTRPTALRQYLEHRHVSEMEKTEAAARAGRESERRAEAARRLEEVLETTKPQAQA